MSGGNTGGTNTGASGSSAAGAPMRAVDAALSSSRPFQPRTSALAMRASNRQIDRLAPERDATRRSAPLRSLAFADRVVGPYMEQASTADSARMFGSPQPDALVTERPVEPASWIFPRPWYLDELAWLSAARAAASTLQDGAALSGGALGRSPQTAGQAPGRMGASVVHTPIPVPLELVAPSMAPPARAARGALSTPAGASMTATGRAPVGEPPLRGARAGLVARARQPLRAWTSLVSFPSVQAAEVMTAALSSAASAGASARAISAESMAVLEYVAPRDVAEPAQREPASVAGSAPRGSAITERARNRLESAMRRLDVRRKEQRAAQEALARSPAAPAATAPSETAAARPGAATTATPGATAPGAQPARAAAPAPVQAIELLARSAVAGGGALAPVAGPRVALPSGMGGLVTGVRARRALSRPLLGAASSRGILAHRGAPVGSAQPFAPAQIDAASGSIAAAPGASRPLAAPQAASDASPVSRGESQRAAALALSAFVMDARPASAFRAVAERRPAAMRHIAWSDRWLARFAGASRESLATMDAVTQGAAPSLQHLAAGAPAPVFIAAPDADPRALARTQPAPLLLARIPGMSDPGLRAALSAPARTLVAPRTPAAPPAPSARTQAADARPAAASASRAAEPPAAAPLRAAPRIDDDAAVPDEVFAAIAAAAARPAPRDVRQATAQTVGDHERALQQLERARAQRGGPRPASEATAAPETRERGAAVRATSRSFADRLLEFGPESPGAGLRSALAASPVAPALQAVFPMPPVQGFDVRAMHASELAQAYLAGWIEPSMALVGPSQSAGVIGSLLASAGLGARPEMATLASLAAMAPASEFVAPVAAPSGEDAQEGTSPSRAASPAPATSPGRADVGAPAAGPTRLSFPGPILPAPEVRAAQMAALSPLSRTAAASAALSRPGAGTFAAMDRRAAAPVGPSAGSAGYAYGPGQAGVRAEAWSVEQERQVADLAFDFVMPELIVAARAYGFGPGEAAQAARLAISGRQGLASLASSVDLAFLDTYADAQSHLAASAERTVASAQGRAAMQAAAGAQPRTTGAVALLAGTAQVTGSATQAASASSAMQAASASSADTRVAGGAPSHRRGLFGMPRRAPRGAFLWPQAAITALDLHGENADERQPLSLAALDVLAARAVADVGVFVAPDGTPMTMTAGGASRPADMATAQPLRAQVAAASAPGAPVAGPAGTSAAEGRAQASELAGTFVAPAAPSDDTTASALAASPAGAAETFLGVPRARLPRSFEALYVALSSSPAGRSLSPAVRAARALALASSMGKSGAPTAMARAAAAWAVMPMVIPGDSAPAAPELLPADGGSVPGGASGAGRERWPGTPGAGLETTFVAPSAHGATRSAARGDEPEPALRSARAGEALRSFVTPYVTPMPVDTAGESATGRRSAATAPASRGGQGALQRVPTAAQPLVNTSVGGPAAVAEMIRSARSKRASGSTDIPDWFEKAARQIFDGSSGDGITLAEMTLVTAAPSRQIAASPKSASSSPASAPDTQGGSEGPDELPAPEVQRIAEEVYAEICRLMEIVRERNGEPWR